MARRPEFCGACGFNKTRGRCTRCGRPLCDGCAQRRSRRVCSVCPKNVHTGEIHRYVEAR